MASSHPALERLRAVCLALPEVIEASPWSEDEHVFRVGPQRKTFASFGWREGEPAVVIRGDRALQATLLEQGPRYFVPSYVGRFGWVGIVIDDGFDWDEAEDLILDAYRAVATRRLRAALDVAPPSRS